VHFNPISSRPRLAENSSRSSQDNIVDLSLLLCELSIYRETCCDI
jgi:predicted secreted protein